MQWTAAFTKSTIKPYSAQVDFPILKVGKSDKKWQAFYGNLYKQDT